MIYRQRCYKNFDELQFRADLIKVNWGSFSHDPVPNSALKHFLKIIEKLLDKHTPYRNIKHPKSQFKTEPWITPGLVYSIKIKNKLYKSFCREKYPQKRKNYERQFKIYLNLISALLRETKKSYYKQYFRDNEKSLKLVWQTIKGIINMKNKSDESVSSLLIDKQLITSARQISNHFNNFFTSIAEIINKNIAKAKKTHLLHCGQENKNTILLSPAIHEDVQYLISSMKTNKAIGPNRFQIGSNILKLFKKEFSKPLRDMINTSFKVYFQIYSK